MFKVCEEVFDLEIKSESNETAWHEDVELWSLWEKIERFTEDSGSLKFAFWCQKKKICIF